MTAATPLARSGFLADRDWLEIRCGGTGGQGVILMGVILAIAATRDHRQVVQTQSYGPEARGGYSRSDVIISDHSIEYPELGGVDLLVSLSQAAATGYMGRLRSNGIFIYDCGKVDDVPPFPSGRSFGIPFTQLAVEETGRAQTTNILTLGAVVAITGVVSVESLREAVLQMVPKGTEELNGRAFLRGVAAGSEQVAGCFPAHV